MPRAVENAEVLRAARAATVLRHWEEVVGPLLASKSVPDRYDKGTVWVAAQSSEWAQELRMMSAYILERLESMAGERGMFVDVRFGVRPSRAPSSLPRPESPEETFSPPRERGKGEEPEPEPGPIPLRDRPAVPPDPIPEAPKPPGETSLTIRERAERRLKNWPGA